MYPYSIRVACISVFLLVSACATEDSSDADVSDGLDDSDEIEMLSSITDGDLLAGDALSNSNDLSDHSEMRDERSPRIDPPSTGDAFDDRDMRDEFSSRIVAGPECPQRYGHPIPGPLIHGVFALYGNAHKIHGVRHVTLPRALIKINLRNSWVPINTLGGDYSVWTYGTQNWWNKDDKQLWIYDDTNPNHTNPRDLPKIREVKKNRTCGFVYMGGDFTSDPAPPNLSGNVTYFYEVFNIDTYKAWKSNFVGSGFRVPVFNISNLSHDCRDLDEWKSFTKPRIHDAIIRRYMHNKSPAIYAGFFADSQCSIGRGAAEVIRKTLNHIQTELNNLSH